MPFPQVGTFPSVFWDFFGQNFNFQTQINEKIKTSGVGISASCNG